jgi:Na+(H+)/acetate symporter ActP
MKVNSEAIYATSASPFKAIPWGRCTKKVSGDSTTRRYFTEPLAIFSMPLAFFAAWLGSVTDKSARAAKEIEAFEDQYVRAQTGFGAAGAAAH